MKKTQLMIALFSTSLMLFGCSNKKVEETKPSATESKKEVVKKKTKESNSSSSSKESESTSSSERTVETQVVEVAQEPEVAQEKSLQGQLEQEAQDKFWEAKSWGWSDEKASAYADGREYVEEQPKVVNSESDAVNIAIGTYGDNGGDWMWGSMGEVDGGYFVKAISKEMQETTMTGTAKSIIVNYDGTITEN